MDDLLKIREELDRLNEFFEQLPNLGVTHVLDCGKCEATLYDIKNDRVETMNHDHILALHLNLYPVDHVVCESAHLGVERKNRSLSQPFDRFKLSKIYRNFEENGIRLSLFPQQ